MSAGPQRRLSTKELLLLNYGAGEDSFVLFFFSLYFFFHVFVWRRFLRVPWTTRQSNQSILKEIGPEYSLEETDAEAEAPILPLPLAKSQLIGKDSDAGRDWRQEEKGMTEDEMVGWHHWLNGHEFEQTPGDAGGAWCASVHGVAKSQTKLSNWTTTTKYMTYFFWTLSESTDPHRY